LARALIVGCGCRGRELGGELVGRGWQVRGTSRREAGVREIESAGFEGALSDPERPGTVLDLCADASVVVWLLGSAEGQGEVVEAIHGPRLERLLEKLVDSPVRGFAYEAAGTAPADCLDRGRRIVEEAGERWRIPIAMVTVERDSDGWAGRAGATVAALLTG
jgi:uncharacterized protein YbjT (DUF2867 family)